MRTRLKPEKRKLDILAAAMLLAKDGGYNRITRDAIAGGAGVSMGLVTKYFGTMKQLRRDIMRHAIKDEVLPIILQGIAANDTHVKKASPELRQRALDSAR